MDSFASELWTAARPLKMLGLEMGTRMTVARLDDDALWVCSPVALDDALRRALDDLGEVRWVVAPNRYHHLFVADFAAAYPDARLLCCPGLKNKRPDIAWHDTVGSASPWDAIESLGDLGFSMIDEVVFLHRPSKTLIVADLLVNWRKQGNILVDTVMRLDGVTDKPAVSRLFRAFLVKNRRKLSERIETLLAWDFDRLIVTHGINVRHGRQRRRRPSPQQTLALTIAAITQIVRVRSTRNRPGRSPGDPSHQSTRSPPGTDRASPNHRPSHSRPGKNPGDPSRQWTRSPPDTDRASRNHPPSHNHRDRNRADPNDRSTRNPPDTGRAYRSSSTSYTPRRPPCAAPPHWACPPEAHPPRPHPPPANDQPPGKPPPTAKTSATAYSILRAPHQHLPAPPPVPPRVARWRQPAISRAAQPHRQLREQRNSAPDGSLRDHKALPRSRGGKLAGNARSAVRITRPRHPRPPRLVRFDHHPVHATHAIAPDVAPRAPAPELRSSAAQTEPPPPPAPAPPGSQGPPRANVRRPAGRASSARAIRSTTAHRRRNHRRARRASARHTPSGSSPTLLDSSYAFQKSHSPSTTLGKRARATSASATGPATCARTSADTAANAGTNAESFPRPNARPIANRCSTAPAAPAAPTAPCPLAPLAPLALRIRTSPLTPRARSGSIVTASNRGSSNGEDNHPTTCPAS